VFLLFFIFFVFVGGIFFFNKIYLPKTP